MSDPDELQRHYDLAMDQLQEVTAQRDSLIAFVELIKQAADRAIDKKPPLAIDVELWSMRSLARAALARARGTIPTENPQ